MKISEYKNEEALDLLADVLDSVVSIFADSGFEEVWNNGSKLKIVQYLLKNHPKEIIQIMARVDGIPLEDYKVNIFTLPVKMFQFMEDEELMNFFVSQGLGMGNESFGSVMENTEETDEQ